MKTQLSIASSSTARFTKRTIGSVFDSPFLIELVFSSYLFPGAASKRIPSRWKPLSLSPFENWIMGILRGVEEMNRVGARKGSRFSKPASQPPEIRSVPFDGSVFLSPPPNAGSSYSPT